MEAYGEVAVRATELVRSRACESPPEAWKEAVQAIFPHSASLQAKGCPRGAYLGLCEEGLVVGVAAGSYTRSRDNKGYAVRAVQLLDADPGLASDGPEVLWGQVMGGESKAHNSQMDVVLALWHQGLLTASRRDTEQAAPAIGGHDPGF